jgi:hypothetical protein
MSEYSFLGLVAEYPDYTLTTETACPYCGSKHLETHGWVQTAVGGPCNHFSGGGVCLDCGGSFVHEYKENGGLDGDKSWNPKADPAKFVHWYVTHSRKVVKGIPGCCGSIYTWTCRHCQGDVKVTQERHNGIQTPWDSGYRYHFTCQKCGITVETEDESYTPFGPPDRETDWKRRQQMGPLKVKIWEKTGIGAFNPRALEKLVVS